MAIALKRKLSPERTAIRPGLLAHSVGVLGAVSLKLTFDGEICTQAGAKLLDGLRVALRG